MKKQNHTVIKVLIFVHCEGWKTGGYQNTLYFYNKKQMKEWLAENDDVEALKIEEVTLEQFSEDYISEL